MTSTFANAALVIARAGYNTVAELGAIGTETICVPAQAAFDDQFERAVEAADRHENIHVFAGKTDMELAELIERRLNVPEVANQNAVVPGARKAAEYLYALLERTRTRTAGEGSLTAV